MAPPSRNRQQRAAALEEANRVRRLRASDKRLLKERRLDARRVLADPPAHWQAARVADLLLAVPAVGHTKVQRILERQSVSPAKKLGGLTAAQVNRLSQELNHYYGE